MIILVQQVQLLLKSEKKLIPVILIIKSLLLKKLKEKVLLPVQKLLISVQWSNQNFEKFY